MKNLAWIYISCDASEGNHTRGWVSQREAGEGLPAISALKETWGAMAFSAQKVAVVLEDDMLYPMRITLEETPPRKELHHYLLWKLKRHLPFAVEQVTLRYLPLAAPNTYLTFALPTAWLDELHQMFKQEGVQCGYIGGLFTTLLENTAALGSRIAVGFFGDFYLMTQTDGRGGYARFSARRLPFGADHNLDLDTLLHHDLEPVCKDNQPLAVQLFNFAPHLDSAIGEISRRLSANHDRIRMAQPQGTPLQRLETYLGGGGFG